MSFEKRMMFSGLLSDVRDDPRMEWEFMVLPPSLAKRDVKFQAKKRKNILKAVFDAIWKK